MNSFKLNFVDGAYADTISVLLNSSLFYWFYIAISDCWHFGITHIKAFPASINDISIPESKTLISDIKNNRIIRYDRRVNGNIYEYKIFKSKKIIDDVDTSIAIHYKLSEEELDAIVNYDIKYRLSED